MIERLERGSIINYRSFIVEDEVDTDYTCKSKVSVFSLSLEKVKDIMKRRSDLGKAYSDVEKQVLFMKHEIALDYLFPNDMW